MTGTLTTFAEGLNQKLISCSLRVPVSDGGLLVDIVKDNSEFKFIFSHDTYSGSVIDWQRKISIGALRTSSSCKLTVYASDPGLVQIPVFYIYKDNSSSNWRLLGVGNTPAPDLVCEVAPSFENEKCEAAEILTPVGINP